MAKTCWGLALFTIHPPSGPALTFAVAGRVRWALEAVIPAGPRGCTPITAPGPRWSDCVFKLRGLGLAIETIHEPHGGAVPGHHGRYVLRSRVTPGAHHGEAA